jgi:hypothetical protein
MSTHEHKASVDERYLLTRHIKLAPVTTDNAQAAEAELNALLGIDKASINPEKNHLDIAYDASFKSLDDVDACLRAHNIQFSNAFWNKVKIGWYKNTDENVKANVKHVPHCCNKMPPGK